MADLTAINLAAFRVFNGYAPEDGSKTLTFAVDFTASAIYKLNAKTLPAFGKMDGFQTVYIDNSGNSQPLTIMCHVTNQSVICPAGAQGYFPVLSTPSPSFTISLPAVGTNNTTWLQFLNVPVPANVWFPNGVDAFGNTAVKIGSNGSYAVVGAPNSDANGASNGSLLTISYNEGFNGVSWDRLRSGGNNADAVATSSLGVLSAQGYNFLWNGGAWDRARTVNAALGNSATGVQAVAPYEGFTTSFNITAATLIKGVPGRVARVSILVAGTTAGTVNDCTTTGAAAVGNQIASIPNAVGVISLNWPMLSGIVIAPGAGQTLAVSYN